MCYSCKLIINVPLQLLLLKFQAKAVQNVGIDVIIVIAVVNTVRIYFKIYLFHKFFITDYYYSYRGFCSYCKFLIELCINIY